MIALPRELPPTAGLPLQASDFLPGWSELSVVLGRQLGTPALQLTCSGTAALLIALRTLRQRAPQRDTVVVPAYTCPLVAIAVHAAGLRVQLCDTRPGHFDMDPDALRAACSERTLAVLPTHLGGRVADVDTAVSIAREVGAWVIEDAAQALGARLGDHSVGLRGDIGFFSLAAGKGLSLFEGGLLVCTDPDLRAALRATASRVAPRDLRWELRRCAELLGLALCYRPRLLPLVYGRPLRHALQCNALEEAVGDVFALEVPQHRVSRWRQSVGARAARRLPAFQQAARERGLQLRARLQQLPGVTVLADAPGTQGTWPLLMVRLPSQRARDAALATLWPAGLGVSRMFIHALPDYAYLRGIVPAVATPQAQDFAARMLTIGNSPWWTDADVDAILKGLAPQKW